MSQKSITSFFSRVPKDNVKHSEEGKQSGDYSRDSTERKRSRTLSSDDSSEEISSNFENERSKQTPTSRNKLCQDSLKKKSGKRARILSSDESGDETVLKEETKSPEKQENKTEIAKTEENENKSKVKDEVEDSLMKTDIGEVSQQNENKTPEKIKTSKLLFGNKTNDDKRKKTTESYNPNIANYNPIKNATWKYNERVPYSALARTLEEIEDVSARLKIIEILSNYFRSVIVLTPEDLLPSVYLCLNKLAPAYEGMKYFLKYVQMSNFNFLITLKLSLHL